MDDAGARARRELGRLIEGALGERGMSQTTLGTSLHPPVTQQTVSRWVRGETAPHLDRFREIEGALGLGRNELWHRLTPPSSEFFLDGSRLG